MSLHALVRSPVPSLQEGERTHIAREPIDFELAQDQHRRYVEALRQGGAEIVQVPAAPELPDSVFIEDTALVLGSLAVIARSGAESRRAETPPVAAVLRRYCQLEYTQAPATFDAGDALTIDRRVYVGRAARTNQAGIEFLTILLSRHGYEVVSVPLSGCLHLKSAINYLGNDTVLLNPQWIPRDLFAQYAQVDVDPQEPMGVSALLVGEQLLLSSNYPRTVERVEARKFTPRVLDLGEFHRAEGGLTCLSILIDG